MKIKEAVLQANAAYAIVYGEDVLGNPTEVYVYAREDAAEALTPLLMRFETLWEESKIEEGKVLRFALAVEQEPGEPKDLTA